MKTLIYFRAAALLLIFLTSKVLIAQPNTKKIVKSNMASLQPFTYDSYAMKEIIYGQKEQSIVMEFSVYSDEEYKLVFCKSELPQSIEMNIYDGNPKSKNKKLIYFDETGKKDQYVCNFHPTQTGSYYIEYKVPPATEKNQKGYIIVLIGVKDVEDNSIAKR